MLSSVGFPFASGELWYVMGAGFEKDSRFSHWGPGRRSYGILQYCTAGTGFFCGRKIEKNQGFYIPPETFHEYHASETDPWQYYWIIFSPHLAEKQVSSGLLSDQEGIFSFDFAPQVIQHFSVLLQEDASPSQNAGMALFFQLMTYHERANRQSASLSRRHVENAKRFMEHHACRRPTVGETAQACNINERYLYNLFIRYEHISPKEYIDRQTICAALDLLKTTGLSVGETARAVGFQDACAFSRFFKKKTGFSPTEVRNPENRRDFRQWDDTGIK